MENLSYIIIYALSLAILIYAAYYVYKSRKAIDEMHGMMIGMTFGMLAGLVTATLFLIPTGNFLYGVIIGSGVGLLFGLPFGKLGGHLGIIEGVVAGPMGGMMGAMLGQMIRPFNIDIFIPFFMFIFLITMGGVIYAVDCRVDYCFPKSEQKESKRHKLLNENFLSLGIIFIFIIIASILLSFSIGANKNSISGVSGYSVNDDANSNSQLFADEEKETTLKNGYQEIDLQITASSYSPNTIVAKKGIPLRINIHADEDAGCGREIVFPDFNIDEIVPAGESKVIEINPNREGTFIFRCSMDMIRGKLIIK